MITVLTAAYGDDMLQVQPPQTVECRWLAVTDHDHHPLEAKEQWTPVLEPRPHLSPRMASKVPKYLPALYVKEDGVPVVWMDCSVQLTSEYAIERFTSYTPDHGVCMIPHPDRRTVESEWPEAAAQGRYAGQRLREQYEWYRDVAPGAWDDDHLWATTIIAQYLCPCNHVMGLKWLAQNCIWTAQDQISLPWVAANSGVPITPITLNLWDNPYFTLRQRKEDK